MTSSFRWQLKKTARKCMALGYWASHFEIANSRRNVPLVRVVTYHRFGHTNRDPFCVSPDDFSTQMAWLAQRELAVSLSEVEAFIHCGTQLKHGAVLVTIDDGCRSVVTHALPILKQFNIPAVAYVSSGNVGRKSNERNQQGELAKEDYMTWSELDSLLNSRIDIGSHSVTHRSLGKMSIGEAEEEILNSRAELEHGLGKPVTSFAYPYGTRADFNSVVAASLRGAGYISAFTSQHGTISAGMDAMLLPRIKVEGGEGNWLFPMLAQGGLDGWRWIDRALWRMQASGRG
jgi:peptidoglycan/xylan/chitin deacetylase (PgdA/CDA1 family)